MSKYADYDSISKTYDQSRKPVGIEIIMGFLASMSKPLNELVVLDAGCGTGNYAMRLREKIARVVGADFSLGMLQQYQKKFGTDKANDSAVRCDISELPFSGELFDAIICNQSLHHLDQPEDDFANQQKFFEHAYRILKPEGLLIINTITHEQLHDGVWWGRLIKPAVERMTHRFTSAVKLDELLSKHNFEITNRVVPVDTIIQEEGYFNPESLRQQAFRNGDSHFSLLSEAELADVLRQLAELESSGAIGPYIEQREKLREQLGQFTFFVARKRRQA